MVRVVYAFNAATFLSEETLQWKHFRKCGCQSPGKPPLFSHVSSFSDAMFEWKSIKVLRPRFRPSTIYSAVKSSATKHSAIPLYSLLDYNKG